MSEKANYGIEVKLKTDFLVVKETLERIGIANRVQKVITPSCYALHKKGKYYLMHFKELLAMDGFREDISEKDLSRRNSIATLLENWGLLTIVEDDDVYQETLQEQIFVLKHHEKAGYKVNHKYFMRRRKEAVGE